MSTENNHINYSAEDIKKYLGGKMSAPEMHAFEKAALEDPFLAEALEGYENTEPNQWQNQLTSLKQEFAKAQNAKLVYMRPPSNRWWKMAAAVFLIGGGVTLFLMLTKNNDNTNNNSEIVIAQNTPPNPENIPKATIDSPTANMVLTETKIVAVKEKGTVASESYYSGAEVLKTDSNLNFVYTPVLKPELKDVKDKTTGVTTDDDTKKTEEIKSAQGNITTNAAPTNPGYNNTVIPNPGVVYDVRSVEDVKQRSDAEKNQQNKKEQTLNRNFIAQVVGPDNSPLPFANISIKSEDFGTYADVKGNFRLISTDSILNVEIKSVGFQPQNFTLRSNVPQNKIILAEKQNESFKDNNLAKKIPNSNTIRRSRLMRDSLENVEPADGWENYDTYVRNNIEIPDDVIKKNVHAEVEISFDVNNRGAISNIRIDKSLCNDCDEAAKKLIEQGPRWKLKDGKKGKAKVKVQF